MDSIRKVSKDMMWWMILISVSGAAAGLGLVSVVVYQVLYGDVSSLEKTTILAKINEETSLYYVDGETRIGSIFESQHRRYISIDEVPAYVKNALIAAEDKNFYAHPGVDPIAIATAFLEGVASGGRFRRGGSTITQQTVKNIMDDWEASFSRKFREMIKALQLERIYQKQQILEFYLNQFHVVGNGNGIGIAAKYYFNKDVRDLNLIEAAFIAGSVKGPSKYNPFIKYTKNLRDQAIMNANVRKNYVLEQMLEQKWISQEEYQEAVSQSVPFQRGEFRTSEVSLVSLVQSQLKQKEVLDALKLDRPEDLNIAGLKVYTTIDADLQKSAQLAMRRNLSRLETILSGFGPEEKENYKPLRLLSVNEFYYGKVEEVRGSGLEDTNIRLSFGLPMGTIPKESVVRYAKLLDMSSGKGYQYQIQELKKKIKVGDILYVEVKEYDPETHEAILEFQKRPRISGGMIALDKGEVRAVVSGFDTIGYNRSIQAKKPPGSVFKSLVYFAALQLGWTILDLTDNDRQVFVYQGRYYFPRADHATPYKETSILWAGVLSENLASVNLGARLLEKLNLEQFEELLLVLDLAPHQGEAPRDYHYRVARAIGVSLDNKGIRVQQLFNAVEDLAPDLVFAGDQGTLSVLRKMHWGDGYEAELGRLLQSDWTKYPVKEIALRVELVRNNFRRFKMQADQLTNDWNAIKSQVDELGLDLAFEKVEVQNLMGRFRVLPNSGSRPALGYFYIPEVVEKPATSHSRSLESLTTIVGRPLNLLDAQSIWGQSQFLSGIGSANLAMPDVKLDGKISYDVFSSLEKRIDQNFESVMSSDDQYELSRYFNHYDFRVGLGLFYLTQLGKKLGVGSRLDPVLSFPLGTNDVTASEVAKVYQSFISGKTYRYFDQGPENQITFIKRIEDRHGNILFEPNLRENQAVKLEYALQMREILRKAVTHGTGSRARGELYLTLGEENQASAKGGLNIRIPAFGKTGTTNDFTTSYFAGFVPYPTEKSNTLDPDNSYVIASYVGYDDNKPMQKGRFKVYGSSGALPMWTDFAKEIIDKKKYNEFIDGLDLQVIAKKEWPVAFSQSTTPLFVDLPRGIVIQSGQGSDEESFGTTDIATTGETFKNEFEIDASIRSVVHLPLIFEGVGRQPVRSFGPAMFLPSENSEDQRGKWKKNPKGTSVAGPIDHGGFENGQAVPKKDGNRPDFIEELPEYEMNIPPNSKETEDSERDTGAYSEEDLW
jgi:membrane peptidoglycan carboxypeptidase